MNTDATTNNIFQGCLPALMTPCNPDRTPNFDALVAKASGLMAAGMNGVIYCGSCLLYTSPSPRD